MKDSRFINHRTMNMGLIQIVFLSLLLLFGTNVIAQENIVKNISGNGGKNTRPFTVEKGWEIQWDAKGDIFQIYLYNSDGAMLGVPANQQGSGKGNSYQAKGGTYYLQVNAIGNWNIKIVQIATSKDNDKPFSKNDNENLVSFSGSGGKNTRPFTVEKGWEIQWDAKGDIFQIYLYNSDGVMLGVPANQQGSGKGSSYQAKSGKYYLQVNAIGDWKINIVRVK